MSIFGRKRFAKERDKTWKANPDELYRAFIEGRDNVDKELKAIGKRIDDEIMDRRNGVVAECEYRMSSDNYITKRLDALYSHLQLKPGIVSSVEKPREICIVAEPKDVK